jgi:hypothetical protein
VYEYSCPDSKKNFDFLGKGPPPLPPYGQNKKKIIFFYGTTVHTPIESPDCVDKNNVVLIII